VSDDSVVIVTGAAGGLGGTMSRGLLAAGRRIVGFDIVDAAIEHERYLGVVGSVRSEDDCAAAVARAIEHFGAVHGLVNNAGMGMGKISLQAQLAELPFFEIPANGWQALIDTNVNGPFLMARAIAPHLIKHRWGRIVNVTTSYTTMVREHFSPYGPAKAALEAATVVWSQDLSASGVTVNVLIPGGAADTPMVPLESQRDRSKLIPPGVMVAPLTWLMSRASDGVTGYRFIGRDWDPAASADVNVKTAGALAGWR
jgi:NAD(P)-dependent dehydrogenase (short-subunit alcohol dehydrogenase family)